MNIQTAPTRPQDRIAAVRGRWIAAARKVKEIFGMDLSDVEIYFNLKGRAAGQARRQSNQYSVRFNSDMMSRPDGAAFLHILNVTVEHEMAHIVCFKDRSLGQNHDAGWARVFSQISGRPIEDIARGHQEDVVFGRGITYEYTLDNGDTVRVNDSQHKYVQSGGSLVMRKSRQRITKACEVWIVGSSGKTLPEPQLFYAGDGAEEDTDPVDSTPAAPAAPAPVAPVAVKVKPLIPGPIVTDSGLVIVPPSFARPVTPAPVAVAAPVAAPVAIPPVAAVTKKVTASGKPVNGTITYNIKRGGYDYWWDGKAEAFRGSVEKCQAFGSKKYGVPGVYSK